MLRQINLEPIQDSVRVFKWSKNFLWLLVYKSFRHKWTIIHWKHMVPFHCNYMVILTTIVLTFLTISLMCVRLIVIDVVIQFILTHLGSNCVDFSRHVLEFNIESADFDFIDKRLRLYVYLECSLAHSEQLTRRVWSFSWWTMPTTESPPGKVFDHALKIDEKNVSGYFFILGISIKRSKVKR